MINQVTTELEASLFSSYGYLFIGCIISNTSHYNVRFLFYGLIGGGGEDPLRNELCYFSSDFIEIFGRY